MKKIYLFSLLVFSSLFTPLSFADSLTILSDIYHIDSLYKSMAGPQSTQGIYLSKADEPELLWITAYEAIMVEADGITPLSQEFMCHSNLDIDISTHQKLFNWSKSASNRLFTLSQGQYEIKLPEDYGIPILSTEALSLTTQVLNHNFPDIALDVRHKITIHFVRDKELTKPMKALFMKSANGLLLTEGSSGYYNVDPEKFESNQLGDEGITGIRAGGNIRTDKYGQKFVGFWIVPPGRQENTTLVTNWMNLPFDTEAHYIASHVHPFAESLELRDLTTQETVFKSNILNTADKIGVDEVDFYSSTSGVKLYKDHEYQLLSIYNNTLPVDQDSMAVMYIYVRDTEFVNPIE